MPELRRQADPLTDVAARVAGLAEEAAPWLWSHLDPGVLVNHSKVIREAWELGVSYKRGDVPDVLAAADVRRLAPLVASAAADYERISNAS